MTNPDQSADGAETGIPPANWAGDAPPLTPAPPDPAPDYDEIDARRPEPQE
ncbi:hypothetical protein GCM10027294_43880 [Marinactinospora endophytica]